MISRLSNVVCRLAGWRCLLCVCYLDLLLRGGAWADQAPRFNRDVRPILSDACFHCHGPDESHREAGLRLDLGEAALESGVLSPGNIDESELLRRIFSNDPYERMPPVDSNRHLTTEQRQTLRRWIEAGAEYEPHWAFVPIVRPELPAAEGPHADWGHNPIDNFVLARLGEAGLQPAPQAPPEVLVRRVYFDLLGLPPSPEEIDDFLSDESPAAYERLVERLMSSPHFAERLANGWLDLARYADTHGYQGDKERTQWPWRDWVIDALDANMPFDQFVTEQLAGDLLPDATREQILATGFCRNHPQNAEGGVIDEEYRVEYVADRVQTFGTAFLGLTLACARCHDHKYDPLSQREFFELFSFFNNVDEAGNITWLEADTPGPTLLLPTEQQQRELDALAAQIAAAQQQLDKHAEERQTDFAAWLARLRKSHPHLPDRLPGLVAHYPLEGISREKIPNALDEQSPGRMVDEHVDRLSEQEVVVVPGVAGQAVLLNGDDALSFPEVGRFSRAEPFSIGLWVWLPAELQSGVIFHNNVGSELYAFKGYQVSVEEGRFDVRIAHEFPHGSIHLVSNMAVPREAWSHVLLTYDGSAVAAGTTLYIDGQPAPVEVRRDNLRKEIVFPDSVAQSDSRLQRQNLRIGARLRGRGLAGGRVDEIVVFHRQLTPLEAAHLAGRDDYEQLLAKPAGELHTSGQQALRALYLQQEPDYAERLAELQRLRSRYAERLEPVVEAMVMDEMAQPRQAHLLVRGDYDTPGEPVEPSTPRAVLPFDERLPGNRLGLAKWLFLPENPLTARVAVNRYWQTIFGRGLVETPDDFGMQGALPSHPELLDWLASKFQVDWDIRALVRLMVTSATYRQSSAADDAALRHDPQNVLLSRGPSRRLTAEELRDSALAASGLLVRKIGGPSVKPYQPDGLWDLNTMSGKYVQDTGESLYRRSMYTFWKQTNPPPSMTLFDAPSRSYCVIRREHTSTPLQSLVLWNDPQFVEASRVMAERLVRHFPDDVNARLHRAYRLSTSRTPTDQELRLLRRAYGEQRSYFADHPGRAEQMLQVGEFPVDPTLPPNEVAATAMVTSMLLNLDDCINVR